MKDLEFLKQQLAETLSEDNADLGKAALLIAAVEYPNLNINDELESLDQLAAVVSRRLSDRGDLLSCANTISEYLFDEVGFSGNREEYYDPKNSFLSDVLATRQGIPITLSIVVLEVAKRLGLSFAGVGLPGHFVVGIGLKPYGYFIDPYNRGVIISREECRKLFTESLGGNGVDWDENFLEPVSSREIIARLQRNLKHIYLGSRFFQKAFDVIDLLVFTDPDNIYEIRDRGIVAMQLGLNEKSLLDLKMFVDRQPVGRDSVEVFSLIEMLEAKRDQ